MQNILFLYENQATSSENFLISSNWKSSLLNECTTVGCLFDNNNHVEIVQRGLRCSSTGQYLKGRQYQEKKTWGNIEKYYKLILDVILQKQQPNIIWRWTNLSAKLTLEDVRIELAGKQTLLLSPALKIIFHTLSII